MKLLINGGLIKAFQSFKGGFENVQAENVSYAPHDNFLGDESEKETQ